MIFETVSQPSERNKSDTHLSSPGELEKKRKENFCSINVDQLFQTETIQLASEKQIENNGLKTKSLDFGTKQFSHRSLV